MKDRVKPTCHPGVVVDREWGSDEGMKESSGGVEVMGQGVGGGGRRCGW